MVKFSSFLYTVLLIQENVFKMCPRHNSKINIVTINVLLIYKTTIYRCFQEQITYFHSNLEEATLHAVPFPFKIFLFFLKINGFDDESFLKLSTQLSNHWIGIKDPLLTEFVKPTLLPTSFLYMYI